MIACLALNPALDLTTSTEKVEPTHKLRCAAPRFDPGGGGINVARVIHELGGEALAIFPAGGATGSRLVELLERIGVPHHAVAIAGETRESVTVDERASGRQYRFVMPGPELSLDEQARCLDALSAVEPRPSHVVVSGSLPPGVQPDFLGQLCGAARAFGAKMVLDTSGPALAAACPGLYLMKPSLRELEQATNAPLPDEVARVEAARRIIRSGRAEVVVVSLGADGALWVSAGGHETLPAIPVEPRSAVGAGDSMVAAMTLGLARGLSVREAVRFGMAAGAAALLSPATGLCRKEDVERLFARMSKA